MSTFAKIMGALAFIPVFILLMMFGLIALTNILLSSSLP